MTIKRLVAGVLVVVAAFWWLATRGGGSESHDDPHAKSVTASRSVDTRAIARQVSRGRTGAVELRSDRHPDAVTISGQVIDVIAGKGVGGIEVVFRTADGAEASATTAANGGYRIEVAPGIYHAFVRDDNVLSIGTADFVRLPGLPDADAANTPDEGLMPTVVASSDVEHLDLSVMHGGVVSGRVLDRSGKPIADAVVRARNTDGRRPALGTDVAESDRNGAFELRLPPGHYILDATHAQLAGAIDATVFEVAAGDRVAKDLTMTAGCVIAGRVIAANGMPAADGALERRYGDGENQFAPAGRIDANGNFRWVVTQPGDVSLRAWPWKSPPSAPQTFTCTDGARFSNVTFQIPAKGPDIDGTLVDAKGDPVPLAFVDIAPLDDGFGQQERADAQGHWSVFNMPAGRYRITATAPGRGVVTAEITAPVSGVRLQLSGMGRLEGTATELADGSFELRFDNCDGVNLSHQPRLVTVVNHHFSVEDLPACTALTATASWHGDEAELALTVSAGNTTHADVDLGPPHAKTVHGTVRDEHGQPLANATVHAVTGEQDTTATTDAAGAYAIATFSGARVYAVDGALFGSANVSHAPGADERVDLVVVEGGDIE